MTIKQWFLKHVNITFLLLLFLMTFWIVGTFISFESGEWVVGVIRLLVTLAITSITLDWWQNHQ